MPRNDVKLQKQSSRKYNDVEYAKWVVVIPPEKVKEAGWKEGEELDLEIKDKKIILHPKKI